MDDHQVTELVDIVTDEQPVLVVVDTLNRCSAGADENSPRDMGQLVASLDRIRDAGAAALPVHHAGKDLSKGARGHTALQGAADAVFKVTGSDRRIRLENEWQKDAESAHPIAFQMVDVARSVALDPFPVNSADRASPRSVEASPMRRAWPRAATKDENLASGSARFSLVQVSPSMRLMRGLSRHHGVLLRARVSASLIR
jgi:hypothetical protein